MTSSLVGSEMCIRDSSVGGEAAPTPQAKRAAEADKVLHKRARKSAPVSYTHLTLPTICSV
eukprot:7026279-Prorocentrum_lima.AAC.1